MENNKTGKLDKFFAGKGFYIVLALCVVVIGVSAYSLATHDAPGTVDIDPGITLDNTRPAPTDAPSAPETNDVPPKTVSADEGDIVTAGTWTEDDVWEEPASWIWPVIGDVERGYTVDALAYDVTMADWRTHDGVDILAQQGEVVCAAADGEVESIEQDDLYGTTVVISHGNGIKTVYSNLADTPTVSVGDTVKSGAVIGSVGKTAICEIGQGSHIHFAMSKDGQSVDPMNYLPA